MLYYAQIYSHMTYCIVVWGSMASEQLLSKLQVEQNKCIKLLNRLLTLTEIYNKYNILTVYEVIDLELKKLGYKVVNKLLPIKLVQNIKTDYKCVSLDKIHKYDTRQKKVPNLPKTNTKNYYNSFLMQSIKRFASLTTDLKESSSLEKFVFKLKKLYHSKL